MDAVTIDPPARATTRPLTRGVDRLLEARRPNAARALEPRERRVETVAALLFVAAAAGLAVLRPAHIDVPPLQAVALVATFAVLARVRFALGSGFTMPTQLALVPIVMLLPPALAPSLVGIALACARAPEVLMGKAPRERLLSSIADGWYVVAPAVLLAVVAPHGALYGVAWPVWLAALGLQLGGDLVCSTLREFLGSGVAPSLQLEVIGQIAVVDVLLSPVGLLAAFASVTRPYAFLLTLPLVAGLAVFARERAGRIADALSLVDDLRRERERVAAAHHRIGETAAASLDRAALEQIIVSTAVDAVEAEGGRLSTGRPLAPRAAAGAETALADVLCEVELSLSEHGGAAEATADGATAIGLLLDAVDGSRQVLAVARRGRRFSAREREVLRTLSEQAAVSLQNLRLHERVQRLAATDELTGLLNHRRLQETLAQGVRDAERYRVPLALVMLDIDDFKQVNDRYGHQQGDDVLRAVAGVIRSSVRETDLPARYGGEELAIVLPHIDLDGAVALAERIREAIAALRIRPRDGGVLTVTASLGVASLDPDAPNSEDLLGAADAALYRAKRAGKNRVEQAPVHVRTA
jgi:diguanylate cyclase (GGDEF)-like protein